jgi:glycosyltransferase involved in cell wall biosynthesis
MNDPRILVVDHAGQMGGAEHVLLDIVRHYGPRRCDVVLFADGPLRGELEAIGIGTTVLAGARGMMGVTREDGRLRALLAVPAVLAMVVRLARMARGYDVLYVTSQKAAVVGMLAGLLIGRPVVWHLHDILSAAHFAALQRRIVVRLANRAARRVIAISEATRQAFVDCGGDARLVVVVPNGIDATRFAGIDTLDVPALRAEAGLTGGALVGLFGRITPWKGHHVLVAALARLPEVHALIVGDALFGEADYKADLLRQAEHLGVADRMHWLGYRADVPRLMRMVDVVVHASTAPEPFGRVIVEGVLAGRPVVASSHGASRELLGEDSGWLVAPEDPAALADTIHRVLACPPDQVAATVRAERERALHLFSLSQMLQRIEQVVAQAA